LKVSPGLIYIICLELALNLALLSSPAAHCEPDYNPEIRGFPEDSLDKILLPRRKASCEALFSDLCIEAQHQQTIGNYKLAAQKYEEALDNSGCFSPDNYRVLNTLQKLIQVNAKLKNAEKVSHYQNEIAQLGRYMVARNARDFANGEYSPYAPGVILVCGDALAQAHDPENAEALYRCLQLNYVKNTESFFAQALCAERLAHLYAQAGQLKKLDQELDQITFASQAWTTLNPGSEAIKRSRLIILNMEALRLRMAGEKARAVEILQKALRLTGKTAGVPGFRYLMLYLEMGNCQKALGNKAKARDFYRKASRFIDHGIPSLFAEEVENALKSL
jgi:tetratricopeptide (TPR) repeat protein